jgi:hypothetical protein
MRISPPRKFPKAAEVNEGSSVSFFKNGKLILEFSDLKQVFYCFAVSLFNYSEVDVLEGSSLAMPEDARHYYSALEEAIPYKDLENNKIFRI